MFVSFNGTYILEGGPENADLDKIRILVNPDNYVNYVMLTYKNFYTRASRRHYAELAGLHIWSKIKKRESVNLARRGWLSARSKRLQAYAQQAQRTLVRIRCRIVLLLKLVGQPLARQLRERRARLAPS